MNTIKFIHIVHHTICVRYIKNVELRGKPTDLMGEQLPHVYNNKSLVS